MTDTPTNDNASAPKAATDWEGIEREYRAGQLSVSEIGRQYGISHTAINKRAKRDSWTRDLTARVNQEVSARLVSVGVSAEGVRETIQLAAERGVALVREHRSDIGALRKAVTKLINELGLDLDLDEALATLDDNDDGGKAKNKLRAALALGNRAQVANTLATTLKTLIPLERQAFNLDAKPDDPANPAAPTSGPVELSENSLAKLASFLG